MQLDNDQLSIMPKNGRRRRRRSKRG